MIHNAPEKCVIYGYLWTVCLHCPRHPATAMTQSTRAQQLHQLLLERGMQPGKDRQTHNHPQPGGTHCYHLSQSSTGLLHPQARCQWYSCSEEGKRRTKKQHYGLCCLVTLQRSEDGKRVGQAESYSRDVKQSVPLLAFVTVREENQFKYNGQRSSVADVVCFLNHPFIEGNTTSIK